MFYSSDVLTGSILTLLAFVVSSVVLYFVVPAAVRNALMRHYKTVRWFERTGEWIPVSGM